jgi:hypothetical protein
VPVSVEGGCKNARRWRNYQRSVTAAPPAFGGGGATWVTAAERGDGGALSTAAGVCGGLRMAPSGAFVSTVVPLIVFFALQNYFVRGLLAGSVKG